MDQEEGERERESNRQHGAIANMVQSATRSVVLRFFVVSFEFMTLHGIDPSAND
jgi:hypothetical protein